MRFSSIYASVRYLCGVIVISALAPADGLSQEQHFAVSDVPVAAAYWPFAVGGSDRKVLPPLDCFHCTGPTPCAPCDGHHREFLYYGTYPWDDDCTNGFNDCDNGKCGYVAAGLSRAWIYLHGHGKWWPLNGLTGNRAPCITGCRKTLGR